MAEKKKRETDWVHIQTPENKNMIASPNYVFNLLNLQYKFNDLHSQFNRVWEFLNKIENRITILERPIKKQEVLNLLKKEKGKHNASWFEARIFNIGYREIRFLLHELETEKKLIRSKSGSQTMYELNYGEK